MQTIDSLGTMAADLAMRAFAEFARKDGRKLSDDQLDAAIVVLKRSVKDAVGPALDDARKALEANMSKVADATFRASMIQAGIRAAKEFFAAV